MTGSQVDILNWHCQRAYGGLTWDQMVKNFADEKFKEALASARQEASSLLSVDDLLFHINGNV